jgi:hypothetical protein
LIPGIRFRVFSRGNENGFVGATDCFVVFERMKQLHGIAITAVRTMAGDGLGWTSRWCKAQRRQAEYDRSAALCINAGRSNLQQGYVCAGRAKVRCHTALIWGTHVLTETIHAVE